jgi:hypothetical protein
MRMTGPSLVARAARNNAEWCHTFCRARGLDGIFEDGRWFSPARTPPLYPDAVTLRPGLTCDEALAGVDRGRGCSVKDSFDDLRLETVGFRDLFSAEWICRGDGDRTARSRWLNIDDDDALLEWEAAWDDDPDGSRFFPPALLDEPGCVFLASYEHSCIRAGAIANRGAGVAGLSNVFALTGDLESAYAGGAAAVTRIWPGLPVVGYDHDPSLIAAKAAGFDSMGPLRIWMVD